MSRPLIYDHVTLREKDDDIIKKDDYFGLNNRQILCLQLFKKNQSSISNSHG